MVVNLPLDIWREVASYLPQDYLAKCYSVNHAFFTIAMEVKYRIVRFDRLTTSECRKYIDCLVYPVASQHIPTLQLTSPHAPSSCKLGELEKTIRRFSKDVTRRLRPWEKYAKSLRTMSDIGSKLRDCE
ncbi:hypothetical protein LshimejAT787_0600980 [Lyophyllum shimeji]|uniref:F-box domain-containing protein n=1 Tax=Lyophyllum shimeji TaxID=47721 RepID=A0A9P3UQ67_LYOSH|nr:hypothetical protein LshimejAT787_0600980 [Lyophyllum shimeji]